VVGRAALDDDQSPGGRAPAVSGDGLMGLGGVPASGRGGVGEGDDGEVRVPAAFEYIGRAATVDDELGAVGAQGLVDLLPTSTD